MKNSIILLILFGAISFATAQSKYDPSYSMNNYKHPNKAAEAKLVKKEGVDSESYATEKNTQSRNYKAQGNAEEQSGASMIVLPVEKNVNAVASSGNYKSAFGRTRKVVPAHDVPASENNHVATSGK